MRIHGTIRLPPIMQNRIDNDARIKSSLSRFASLHYFNAVLIRMSAKIMPTEFDFTAKLDFATSERANSR